MHHRTLAAAALAAAIGLTGPAVAAPVAFSDSGALVTDLTGAADPLTAFRAALGNNLGAGPNAGNLPGRREINWDAAALDGVADPNFMPADQFNRLAAPFARGAVFSTPGSGFFISRRCEQDGAAPGCGGSNILLGLGPDSGTNVNFRAFSEQRIFTPVGSNQMDVTFTVPGQPGVAATTSAFGAIFLDVEVDALSTMELFDGNDQSLGLFDAAAGPEAGFSFLGVQFTGGERIARVRLTLGDMQVLGHGSFSAVRSDLVALDDFFYAEPAAIPEPASWALLALGGAAMLRRRRR
jgi:PEP-CTERM motif